VSRRAEDERLLRENRDVLGLRRGNAVLLHLDVQCLVVGSKQPRRLALVSARGLKGKPDRLALRLGDGPIGDLLQRRARLLWLRMSLASKHDVRNSRANHIYARVAASLNWAAGIPYCFILRCSVL